MTTAVKALPTTLDRNDKIWALAKALDKIDQICSLINFEAVFETNPKLGARGDSVKMNQLQNLLHDALVSTDHVQHCAIIRRKDMSVRATSVGFQIFPDQIQVLLDSFKNPPGTREEGLYFDGKQHKCVRADKNSIYAKHAGKGVVLVRTNTLMLMATYSENMFPSVCVEAVEKLADYFREKGK